MQAPVPRLSATPATVRWTGHTEIGADADEVYRDILGMTEDEA